MILFLWIGGGINEDYGQHRSGTARMADHAHRIS